LRRADQASGDPAAALSDAVGSEKFRAALGRIACGYDGGQVTED